MRNTCICLLLLLTSNLSMANTPSQCQAMIDEIVDIADLKKALQCQNRLMAAIYDKLEQQGPARQRAFYPAEQMPSTQTDSHAPQVKKSKSNICHERGTKYYNQTKTFTPYNTIEGCLSSGGRLPKG